MIGLIILIVFALIAFGSLTFFRKYSDSFILIAYAIGTAINANIFHAFSTPVVVGNIIFGIDSILYTLFLFTVAVKYIHYPAKEGKSLIYAVVVAIIISAAIEFFAKLSNNPDNPIEYIRLFGNYLFSALGTLLACFILRHVIQKFEEHKMNRYLTIFVSILIGTLVNSLIYFGGLFITSINDPSITAENVCWALLGSIILKTLSVLIANISYLVSTTTWIPNELKDK